MFLLIISSCQPFFCFSQQIFINNGATIQSSAYIVVANGGVTNLNSGYFDNTGSVIITGNGNWENYAGNTGFVNNSPGNVVLSGDVQKIRGTDITVFYDLILDGTGIKMLDSVSAVVTDSLILNHLELSTDTNSMYVTHPDPGIITRTTGFVSSLGDGKLSRTVNQTAAYLFPVGSSVGTQRYRPVEITPSTNNTDTFKVRMANADATTEGFDRTIKDSSLCQINPGYYHRIRRDVGNDPVDISLYFDDAQDGNYSTMAHWQNQPRWENMGNVNAVNNSSPALSSLTKNGWMDFSYEAFALSKPAPPVSLAQSDSAICSGDSVSFTSSPAGYSNYEFFVNNVSLQTGNNAVFTTAQLSTGDTVRVEASDSTGCIGYSNMIFNLTVHPAPNLIITTADTVFCPGDSTQIIATASAMSNYIWSNGATTQSIMALTSGDYIVTATTSNGCTGIDSISILVFETPVPIITASGSVSLCEGDSVVLSSDYTSGNQWSSGASGQDITVVSSGTYTVSVLDSNGCSGESSPMVVQVNNNPQPIISGDSALCNGEAAQLTATSAASYLWSTNATTQNITVDTAGIYSVTVTDANGCVGTSPAVSVEEGVLPLANAGNDTTIFIGESIALFATGGATYLWSPATGLSCTSCQSPQASPESTTLFYVTVTSSEGCSSVDTVKIEVLKEAKVGVPNIFSPNGDGQNEILRVRGKGIDKLQFIIFDRWGEKVFESEDINTGWDGTYKGEPMNSAVFVYLVKGSFKNGESFEKKGNVTLLR